ncbi:MAG: CvpA family protein [Chloroflexi bacterium]|nr:CvpA family protein [Chloroflexota bacterium]
MTQYGVALFDLLFIAALLGGFVAGFVQGVVRRLLGIAATMIAFLLAANLRVPVGEILADSWTQFPPDYVMMLAFLGLFVIFDIFATVLIQGFYHRAPVVEDKEWVDEILGGVLGVVQALLLLGIAAIILGSYFGAPTEVYDPDEFGILRTVYDGIVLSTTGTFILERMVPVFMALGGPLIPDSLRLLFVR